MEPLKSISLTEISEGLRGAVKPVRILWQTPDTIAFVARGRKGRSEYHNDPSDEVMYMIKGDMNLHYRTPEGEEKLLVLKEGEIMHCPAGVPHSPRFSPDSFLLVLERKRRGAELDRFQWYCENCRTPLYETVRKVADYNDDPVSRVYEEFYSSDEKRTCPKCGTVAQRPA
jgi:3-hydroxyanthranilate 3,4-dioxygenase